MGRGYSATRSKSARKTVKVKRQRSLSKIREQLSRGTRPRSASTGSEQQEEGEQKGVAISRVDYDSDDVEESEDESERVNRQDVLTKYKMAGKLVDEALATVVAACVPGASTKALCAMGDEFLAGKVTQTMKHSKTEEGKRIQRGLAVPTTVSVNNVLCNHVPFTEEESVILSAGDVVKVHAGCYLDGYPCTAAKTIFVAEDEVALKESQVRAFEAARTTLACMVHMMQPGTENADITDMIATVGNAYGVEACEGVLSTRTKRWISDSLQSIICRRVSLEDPQQDVVDCNIDFNQVWTLDVAFTNAPEYKMRTNEHQCNIFRRNEVGEFGDLRIKAATYAAHEIRQNLHCFPFTPNQVEEPLKMRLGLTSLKKEGWVDEYGELQCKAPYITTRFSCTVSITNKRIHVLCGDVELPADLDAPTPAVGQVLSQPLQLSGGSANPSRSTDKLKKKRTRKEE